MRRVLLAATLAVTGLATVSQAAFIVESSTGGKAFSTNFSGNSPSHSTTTGSAVGLTAGIGSVFGGAGTNASTDPDKYVLSYKPGTNADNTVLSAGTALGNGNLATGLTGGVTGMYNVYITWPASTNVDGTGCKLVITSDGSPVTLNSVNMNTGGTGTPGANNAWYKIASDVTLTAGNTYTVTQTANSISSTSMRNSGVMWEYVGPVPEPASLSLLACAALPFLSRRRVAR